jgi:hypothetical protein
MSNKQAYTLYAALVIVVLLLLFFPTSCGPDNGGEYDEYQLVAQYDSYTKVYRAVIGDDICYIVKGYQGAVSIDCK